MDQLRNDTVLRSEDLMKSMLDGIQQKNKLKPLEESKCLGAWIQLSEKNMGIRIGPAWGELNELE